jgi:hypothetical protein
MDTLKIYLPFTPYFYQITTCGSKECLILCACVPQSIASNQETHFTAKEVQQWGQAHGIDWSYHVPHHPEVSGIIKLD